MSGIRSSRALITVAALAASIAATTRARAETPAGPTHGGAAIWNHLAERYDVDRDGTIAAEEYGRAAERFKGLDRNKDGVLSAADFAGSTVMDRYVAQAVLMRHFQADNTANELQRRELCIAFRARDLDRNGRWSLAEFIRVRIAFRKLSLGAPDMPEGVMPWPHVLEAVDRNDSGDLDLCELLAFFDEKDKERTGRGAPPVPKPSTRPKGPAVGEEAPDFVLASPDGSEMTNLAALRGKPVALVFGSYT